jgi:hypothetical protein
MSTSINTVAARYASFLKAGTSYGEALKQAAAEFAGTPCSQLLAALAKVHAAHFKCNVSWSASGAAQFFDGAEYSRDTRHDAARMSWARNVMTHFKSGEPTTRQHKPVDAVAKLAKAYAGLTAAQKRRFLAML